MKKNLIIELLITACCWLVCSVAVQAQFSGGAVALTESKVAWRAWHITNKRGSDFLLRVSGNILYATNNTINDASTFVIDSGPDDSNWTTPDSRWFYIRNINSGQYITVASSGDLPRPVTMGDYDETNYGQQFRLIATVSPTQYKLRSRLSSSGPDIVLETDANGLLRAGSPKVDPSSEQKFSFNLAMPSGGDRTYALVGTFKGRYMSDNGIKVDGTQAVQKKDSDESGIWKLTPQGNNFYHIQNNLTKHYLTAPAGSVHGSIPIMTTGTFGDRSLWLLDPKDVNFHISNKEFPQLFISATSMPSGEVLRLRTSADVYRSWVISLMPGELEIEPGAFDAIESGTLSSQCFFGYGANFKRALCERVGLNPAQSELYFEFIRDAIAAKMGQNRVDEILQKMELDNTGHRIDLALMVRYYLTEVLTAIPYGQWPPAAQAAATEWQNKVQAIRSSYGSRLKSSWDAYVAEQGNNISFADLYFFWLDEDGYEWPAYYQTSATQEELARDYARGAATFGERNNVIVGSTAVGATVAFSIAYASSAGIKFVISKLTAYFSASVKLLGITASFPMASIMAAAGPPLSVAVFAASSLSMQVMEVIELQDFLDDIDADYLWSQQPVNIPGTLSGNDLLARVKLLSDLDFILGAPVTDGFLFNTNHNNYLPPFTVSCNATVTLPLDENGAATLTPAMCASVSLLLCGTPIQYFLSKSQFDCDDLGAANSVAYAALTTVSGIPSPYVQRCTLTVNVVDEILPTITCPGNQTLTLGGNNCSAILPDYTALATNVTDNCGGVTVSQSPEAGTVVSGGGDMIVTLRVFPLNGVTVTCTFIVTKIDNTPPLVVCPLPQTLVLSSDCTATIPDYSLLTTTYDACGIGSLTQLAPPGFTVSGTGTITALMILTDVNNNTSQCSFTITKVDNTPPTITCPTTGILALGANCTAVLPDYRSLATAADNCGVQGLTQSPAAGTIVSGAGNMTVTLTVTDINGNSTQCTFTVTKVDNTPPTITCPGTQTLVLGANCTAALPDYRSLATAADNCGVQGVTQSPAAGTTVSGAGNLTVTLTATDMSGNSTQCTFTVTKVDNTPPTVQCFNQTLTFNGQEQFVLNANDLVDASDNCGVGSITFSPPAVTCAQVGQVVPVTATVADINGNTSTCTSQITVNGLPCGWIQNPDGVGCANGSNIAYNPVNGVWTTTSTNCYSANFSSDVAAFAQRSLCGDGSVTAQVTSVSGAMGWAGIVMRESNAAGAKKAQLMTNLSSLSRQEFRSTTGGQAMPQQFASQNRFWLRIVRTGNQFSMYASPNGQSWAFVGAQNIAMNACIQVGLVSTNATPNSTVTATFANVSFGGGGTVLAESIGHRAESLEQPQGFEVYPNPTSGELNVDLEQYTGRNVQLEVYSLTGQLLRFLHIEEVQTTVERIDLTVFQNGMYLVKVKSDGLPDVTRRVVLAR